MRASLLFTSVAVGIVLLACSGKTDDVNSTTASSPQAACADAAKKLCEKLASCSTLLVQSVYGTTDTCEQRAQIDCIAGLEAKGTNTTGADTEACASALASGTCEQALALDATACRVKAGTLVDGTACSFDGQCAGTNCRKTDGTTCGVCSTRKDAGGDCKTNSDCNQPLNCVNQKCVQRGTTGAACTDAAPCDLGLWCKAGVCSKPLGAGEACDPKASGCDLLAGLVCNPKTRVCAVVKLADPGQPCGLVDGTLVGCSGSAKCKGATTTPGTCLAPAADGQPCDATNGPDCLPPATCANKVCALPDANACH